MSDNNNDDDVKDNINKYFLRQSHFRLDDNYFLRHSHFQRVILMSGDNNNESSSMMISMITFLNIFQAVPFSTGDSDVWQHFLMLGSG